jgi:hypothetical protein
MNLGRIFVSTLTVLAIGLSVSCGHDDNKEAMDLRDELSKRVDIASATTQELETDYGISLSPVDESVSVNVRAGAFDWSQYSKTVRQVIRTKLVNHRSNIERIFEIVGHKNVSVPGDTSTLRLSSDNAEIYLEALNAYEEHPGPHRRGRSRRQQT